jgi:hypothetical protein
MRDALESPMCSQQLNHKTSIFFPTLFPLYTPVPLYTLSLIYTSPLYTLYTLYFTLYTLYALYKLKYTKSLVLVHN